MRGQIYHVGDFIYIEPVYLSSTSTTNGGATNQCHIGRITRLTSLLNQNQSDLNSSTITGSTNVDKPILESQSDKSTGGSGLSSVITQIRVAMYLRPSETHPSKRRRLLAAEVFRTALGETIGPNQIVGRCLVMPISQFILFRPKVIYIRLFSKQI